MIFVASIQIQNRVKVNFMKNLVFTLILIFTQSLDWWTLTWKRDKMF